MSATSLSPADAATHRPHRLATAAWSLVVAVVLSGGILLAAVLTDYGSAESLPRPSSALRTHTASTASCDPPDRDVPAMSCMAGTPQPT